MALRKQHRVLIGTDESHTALAALATAGKFPWLDSVQVRADVARFSWLPAVSEHPHAAVEQSIAAAVNTAGAASVRRRWKSKVMKRLPALAILALLGQSTLVLGQDLTWRKDIRPLIEQKCDTCHGASAPSYEEWNLAPKSFEAEKIGPRMDNYSDCMRHVVWPATGSLARRLDDGKNTGGKPGNHYAFLGDTDAERAKNLAMLKSWLGEGAWNLNRWEARDKVPAISKEQLGKIKAKY